jgi:hypothetical protein
MWQLSDRWELSGEGRFSSQGSGILLPRSRCLGHALVTYLLSFTYLLLHNGKYEQASFVDLADHQYVGRILRDPIWMGATNGKHVSHL